LPTDSYQEKTNHPRNSEQHENDKKQDPIHPIGTVGYSKAPTQPPDDLKS
jgi:hypothetical protein